MNQLMFSVIYNHYNNLLILWDCVNITKKIETLNSYNILTRKSLTLGRVRVINATFINISVISWQSVLLVEETGVPGENHRPVASH